MFSATKTLLINVYADTPLDMLILHSLCSNVTLFSISI